MATRSGGSYAIRTMEKSSGRRNRRFNPMRGSLVYSDHPGSAFWTQAETIANEMVDEYKDKMVPVRDSPPAGPIVLQKLQVGLCEGVDFSMDFQVTHENGSTSNYYAEVWVKPGKAGVVHRCLEKVIRPATSKKRKEVEIIFTTKSPPPVLNKNVFDGIDEDSIESVFGKNCCKLRRVGFQIFLKQLWAEYKEEDGDEDGDGEYDRVRNTASKRWKNSSEEMKVFFMEKAALKLKEKWLEEKKEKEDSQ